MKTSLLALAAVAGMALTACDDDASTTATTTTTSSTTTASTTTSAASAESNGGAPGDEVCPLTAEEVSAVIGSTVAENESCQYFPPNWPDSEPWPHVSFAYQPVSACTPDNLRTAGYPTEPFGSKPGRVDGGAVDGFGVDAYAYGYSLGLIFIVCDADQPFELHVDGVQGDDVPIAIALATLARDG